MADANYSSVTLLLHGNGENGGTHFIDDSKWGMYCVPSSATTSSTYTKFNSTSMYFNGTTGFLTIPDRLDSRPNLKWTGDFTVEFQIRVSSLAACCILGVESYVQIGTTATGAITIAGSVSTVTSSAGAVVVGSFVHIAIARSGTTLKIFADGVEVASATVSGDFGYSGGPQYMGKFGSGSPTLEFYLEEFRVTAGVCRYTAAFTPPTAAFDPINIPATGGAYRHWRLNVSTCKDFAGTVTTTLFLPSLEMRSSSVGANLSVTGNGTAYAKSDQGTGWTPDLAFDSNSATFWYAVDAQAPHWIRWDFLQGNAQNIAHLTILNSNSYNGQVSDAALEYSDDAVNWATLMSIAGRATTSGTSTTHTYTPPISGNASVTGPVGTLYAFGGGFADIAPRAPFLTGYGGATAALTAPSPTSIGFSGSIAELTAPSGSLVTNGHNSTGEWSATLTAPSALLSSYGGANANLTGPMQSLSISGTAVIFGSASLDSPLASLAASATSPLVARAALTSPSPNLVGYSGAVCSVSVTGHPTLQATGTTSSTSGAQLTCPLFELTAGATVQNHGSANLIAPSPEMGRTAQAWLVAPGAQLTAIGSAVITATYEAYATNLKHNPRPGVEPHDEVTHYTNFPFTHVVRYQNSYYGANSTGLYLLEGTTDDVTPIPWNWKTATTDFKSPQNKTVASAYFGGRLGPADTITLHAGEGAKVQAYSYTTPRGALAQNYRQAFGKGIKSHRYYALEASGTGELALDDISLDVHNLSRRI